MTVTTVPQIVVIVNPLPKLEGEPVFDPAIEEYVCQDSDGIRYYGSSPLDCYRQFMATLVQVRTHLEHCPEDAGLRGDLVFENGTREAGKY